MSKLVLSKELSTPSTPATGFVKFYPQGSVIKYVDDDGTVYTLATGISTEDVQDIVGALMTDSSQIDFTYNDPANQITASIVAGSITDTEISNSAAIAYFKLNLSNSIVNADIAAAAAIAYSKLNLSDSIVNADIAAAAAIARTKIANGAANHVVINDGSGTLSSEALLAVSRGGTNSGAALNNSRLMVSSSSAIVEAAQIYQDNTNHRIGLNQSSPSSNIDINGANGYTQLRLRQTYTPTSISDANGAAGNVAWDDQRVHLKTSEGWKLKPLEYFGTVSTTNNTATTIVTIPTSSNQTALVEAWVVGHRTGGSAGTSNDGAAYFRRTRINNDAGTVTTNDTTTEYTSEDQGSWNVTYVVSGTNVDIRVTGAINNNINWRCEARVIRIS